MWGGCDFHSLKNRLYVSGLFFKESITAAFFRREVSNMEAACRTGRVSVGPWTFLGGCLFHETSKQMLGPEKWKPIAKAGFHPAKRCIVFTKS